MSIKIHLDTDLGGDLDDLCALAMLLHWPGVDITGITVVGDNGGKRTGYVRYALQLAGRADIPVAAGADVSGGYYRYALGLPPEARYWPEPVPASPNPPEEAVRLLRRSLEQGAMLIGIGPYTNLALLEARHPGILNHAPLVLMGGWVYPPRPGYPNWGSNDDFNVQVDVRSARAVLEASHPTLAPLTVTVETALRRAHLPRLGRAGPLERLIARQALAFAEDEQIAERFGLTCAGLPADILNFQHDPLACAIALGWAEGVEVRELPLRIAEHDGWLSETIHPDGRPMRVVTKIDGARFDEFWLEKLAPTIPNPNPNPNPLGS